MLAIQNAKNGNNVTLNFKFGKLTLTRGLISFVSEKLSQKYSSSAAISTIENVMDDLNDRSTSPGPLSHISNKDIRSISAIDAMSAKKAIQSPQAVKITN